MATHPDTVPYLDAFRGSDAEPQWLGTARQAALTRFADTGFPTRREEAWRFTDLRPLQRTGYTPASGGAEFAAADIAPWRFAGASHRIVLVNGSFAPELSDIGTLPAGAWLASTARTLAERPALVEQALAASDEAGRQPFAALNAAFFADGFVLALEPGTALTQPVEVIHLGRSAAPRSFHFRSFVLMGADSSALLLECFAGDGAYWTNDVLAIEVGAGAALSHIRLQDEGREAIHIALSRAWLGKGARYDSFALTLGGRLARHDIHARLAGEGASCRLDGAFLLRRDQEATTVTFVEHASPGGTTRELYKGVVDDRAHGVFLGRIAVRPDAQRSDAQQLNRNLLLSRRASVDTKPELEILADDVKCSHGATVGDLDEQALFYLRARGIPEDEARRMLIAAFATETLDLIADGAVREHMARHLERWLGGGDVHA